MANNRYLIFARIFSISSLPKARIVAVLTLPSECDREAVKGLSRKFREENAQIPWAQMAGMRDRLIHA